MSFDHASHINARQSNISNTGRDQHNLTINIVTLADSAQELTLPRVVRNLADVSQTIQSTDYEQPHLVPALNVPEPADQKAFVSENGARVTDVYVGLYRDNGHRASHLFGSSGGSEVCSGAFCGHFFKISVTIFPPEPFISECTFKLICGSSNLLIRKQRKLNLNRPQCKDQLSLKNYTSSTSHSHSPPRASPRNRCNLS
jgi:hypothetical protein